MNFTNKKGKVREILHSHNIGETTTDEETAFISSFFRIHHPDWYIKTKGINVVTYRVVKDPVYKTICFQLELEDGTTDDIGYGTLRAKPKDPVKYKHDNICAACRNAIDEAFIKPMRNEVLRKIDAGIPVYSDYSGNPIQDANSFQIDHYDLCFDELVTMFIVQNGLDFLYEKVNMGETLSTVTKFTDEKIKEEFIHLHENNTHLRVVTKNENLSDLRSTHQNDCMK